MALEPRDPAVVKESWQSQSVGPGSPSGARRLKAAGFSPPKLQRAEIGPHDVSGYVSYVQIWDSFQVHVAETYHSDIDCLLMCGWLYKL